MNLRRAASFVVAALVVLGVGLKLGSPGFTTPLPPNPSADSAPPIPKRLSPPSENIVRRVVGGPETAGSVVTLGGRSVQLPPDAYVTGEVTHNNCLPGPCPETPALIIRRGNSTIYVGIRSGLVDDSASQVIPGEAHLFEFLKGVALP